MRHLPLQLFIPDDQHDRRVRIVRAEGRRLAHEDVLACGRLTIDGAGTFALDAAGQPIGAMTARIQGYEAAVDDLAADKAISAHTAATAKILLRAMARSSGEGVPVLSAPVSIQDRTVSVGPVALLKLDAVHWLDGGGRSR